MARWALLVAALVVGLFGMHTPGTHALGAHIAGQPAGHAVHPHEAVSGEGVVCAPEQPGVPAHADHCIPAPGGIPPAPPGVVALERSDALPLPPVAHAPGAVLARPPAIDLTQLSISRT
ncbi:DUF6153 family protein [Sinomonas notoginsengisoli]|uniref:DUF6153 family protein n=1 Tax=Sinomonas notoginsengisoli TaxID=1457311 RepID=UPI001F36FB9B|nr:DUF6153 family protein [Sinomonas notoginsengisoli]